MRYCRIRGCKVYVTMNTLVNDREIESALQTARLASEAGADGIIIQDLGLAAAIRQYLPEGPQYYPADMISDLPENMLIGELVREQALLLTNDEVPHSLAVNVTELEERENGTLYVSANIYVERESQKGIIIGKHGAMLKEIGSRARAEVEKIFACPVYLELRVRAKKDWRNNEGLLDSWEYQEL